MCRFVITRFKRYRKIFLTVYHNIIYLDWRILHVTFNLFLWEFIARPCWIFIMKTSHIYFSSIFCIFLAFLNLYILKIIQFYFFLTLNLFFIGIRCLWQHQFYWSSCNNGYAYLSWNIESVVYGNISCTGQAVIMEMLIYSEILNPLFMVTSVLHVLVKL